MMASALPKLISCTDKILAALFLKVLPQLLRFIILSICILSKQYRQLKCSHKYMSIINKKSHRFAHGRRAVDDQETIIECSICLSEFEEGDRVRRLVDCGHSFHGHCLEKWLVLQQATCPLCRRAVVPAGAVAEYHRVQLEKENDGVVEKELAIILLSCLCHGRCNRYFWHMHAYFDGCD